MEMDKNLVREVIAKRVAQEFHDGYVVNLGIGLPTLVANYVGDMDVIFQSENGCIGVGPAPEKGKEDPYLVNAGGGYITAAKGAMFFDSAYSFGIIRGGHVDATVLGALEVDEKGNLANWMIPGKKVPGMGGAMDLVVGAKHVIVAMEHTSNGAVKILKETQKFEGVYSSGGDITIALLEKLKAIGVEIREEVIPLAAYGRIIGGDFPNLKLVSKGGMVGDEKTIKLCLHKIKNDI